ncbi:MAG TPA: hypothetical protein VHB30_02180 [Solirubrobacteraceae bacterium]|jgi:hypothetical protein|nr:hypothetical protein [Solirubrobacteraceae bacterium]
MSDVAPMDFEARVRAALAPVDPPPTLADRLEARLASLTETAIEELDALEISAMRDPRNWVRPVIAAAVAATAGAGLLVLRLRSRGTRRPRLRLPGR